MNEYIQEKIASFYKLISEGHEAVVNQEEVAEYKRKVTGYITDFFIEAYNRGVEDTKKKIAKWIDDNTGAGGDVSYPDLMKFMADTKDIDEAITKLLNK